MSLANQTCWVVGGVGIMGRGITRGLLQAGATVICNSRSEERLSQLSDSLGHPSNLVLVKGSLLPGHAKQTVMETLEGGGGSTTSTTRRRRRTLHHVVSHGAVRWWAKPSGGHYEYYEYKPGCDETYSLSIRGNTNLLDMTCDEFQSSSAQLASLHFAAAQELLPRLVSSFSSSSTVGESSQPQHHHPTYTFVTGDAGSNKTNGKRTSMGEINSHHVWGLSAALREELSCETTSSRYHKRNTNNNSGSSGDLLSSSSPRIMCREIRVGLPISPPPPSQTNNNDNDDNDNTLVSQNISNDIGKLCAGLAATSFSSSSSEENAESTTTTTTTTTHKDEYGKLLQITSQSELDHYMAHYHVSNNNNNEQ